MTEPTRDIDDAIGFERVNGEWVPIFEWTPELEAEFYAAGEIGPEGLTMCHSRTRSSPRPDLHRAK